MDYLIDDEVIERVRSSSDILEIISQYVSLKKTGINYMGLCPFHSEKTPSFTVSPSKQLFHCFGCGEGGDVISFIMKEENLPFPEAVKLLADRAGIIIEEKEDLKSLEIRNKRDTIYQINKEAARFFYRSLFSNQNSIYYLKKRSINKKTVNKFGIGYADSSWNSLLKYMTSKGYSEDDLEMAGLIKRRNSGSGFYDRFRNRIIFPIINTRGNIVAFGGRSIDSTMPKYLNTPETLAFSKGNQLYGLNIVNKETDRSKIIIVEGYMDVVSLYNNGVNYSVASLGTAFTPNQGKLIKKFNKEVYICFDSDLAGLNAVNKAIGVLKKQDINAKVLILPKGYDPDDFIKDKGKDNFEKLFNNSLNYIDFKIHFAKLKYNLKELNGKIQFTKEMGEFLMEIDSPIERDLFLDKISLETGISKEAISKEFSTNHVDITTYPKDKYNKGDYRNNKDKITPVNNVLEPAGIRAEKCIVSIMAKDNKTIESVKEKLKPEDFLNNECRRLVECMFSMYEVEGKVDIEELLNLFPRDEYNEILKQNINISEENMDSVKEDLIETIIHSKLMFDRNNIVNEIYSLDSKKEKNERDVERFKGLRIKLIEIEKKLRLH